MGFIGSTLGLFGRAFVGTFGVVAGLVAILAMLGTFAQQLGAEGQAGQASSLDSRYSHVAGREGSSNRLLAIPVRGPILGSPREFLFDDLFDVEGVAYGYRLQEQLAAAAKDESIRGVFLEMDTPGGTIFGSQAIFDGLVSFRNTGRPVVAHVEGMSASGGVWAMVGADAIYADVGTAIGSIGVIGPMLVFYDEPMAVDGGLVGGGITTRRGIGTTLLSAGRGKDFGNPFRKPSVEELRIAQRSIDDAYAQFVAHVGRTRGIDGAKIRDAIGAYVYGNEMAREIGLIDGTKGRPEAIAALAERAGVAEDYALVREEAPSRGLLATLFSGRAAQSARDRRTVTPAAAGELCGTRGLVALAYHGDPRALCAAAALAPPSH